ncbi:MAG: division/cell wall cluster transcriptional repressor MraZ [Gammaproteobacteria bacterium]|nr:division/cell wall cluster transcriptional repressor MraZ [Gammaproteobacteria bacterium]
MFRGVSSLSLDSKGRMVMPSRYRQKLQEMCDGQLIVTVDLDHCLMIYPLPEWDRIEAEISALPSLNPQAKKLKRLIVGHATDVEMDGSGRLLIPPPLRGFAELDKHVVLIGQGAKFELWDESLWSEKRDTWMDEDIDLSNLPSNMENLSF